MNIKYPYRFDRSGRTARTDDDDHIRDMIEQILFTSPGERVNRPDFGSGLLGLVFEPNSDILGTATQQSIQGSLQEYLGDRIRIEAVDVRAIDSTLSIHIQYIINRTQERRSENFKRELR